jgi:ankyrin
MGYTFANPLHRAAQAGDEAEVRRLMKKSAKVNSLDGIDYTSRMTPLQVSAKSGHIGIVVMLLEAGARINHKDSQRKTALIYACEQGHSEVVSLLLNAGGDINAVDREGLTPLHCASRHGKREVVEKLLKAGANVNALNDINMTPLADISFLGDVVAWNGDLSITLLLLKAGTNLTTGGGKYGTPLAARFGTTEEAQAILDAGADVNARGGYYETALQAVCDRPIQSSAHATVDLLLEKGADVNITGGACYSALFAAAGIGDMNNIARLLENGADIHHSDILEANGIPAKVTALGIAAARNQKDAAEALLHAGADPSCYTSYGYPALMVVSSSWTGLEIFSALIEAGADVNAEAVDGGTALHEAACTGSFSKVCRLLEAGAIVEKADTARSLLHAAIEGGNLNVFEILKARGAQIEPCLENTTTLMHTAATYDRVTIMRKLLKLQRDAINVADQTGKTPLHLAAQNGHVGVVNLLLNAGSNVHTKDRTGMTPLHFAAAEGNEKIVKILLQVGADPNAQDNRRRTSLKVAADSGHVLLTTVLRNSKTPRKLRRNLKTSVDIVFLVRYFYMTAILMLAISVVWNRLRKP